MTQYALLALDLVAISVLAFGVYFPRHRRRDLVVAYLGVNVGVLAVSAALAQSAVGAGLGLGLFGVLSIIRLRSTELTQHEVAYYFSALALGLLGGLAVTPAVLNAALMVLVVAVMAIVDHPRMLRQYRQYVLNQVLAGTAGASRVVHDRHHRDDQDHEPRGERAGDTASRRAVRAPAPRRSTRPRAGSAPSTAAG